MSVFFWVVVCLIAVLIVYYFFFRNKKEVIDNRTMTIENVGPDGVLSITGFGGHPLQVNVTDKITHQEEENFWYELEGETENGDGFWLQIESIEPYILNAGHIELDFHELGLSEHDLHMLPIGQEVFLFEGEKIYLDSIGDVQAFNHGESEEDFRWYKYWEMSNENSDLFVTVEHYEGDRLRVFVSLPIESHQIRIFDLGINV
jgi:hypothetical protein